MSTRTARVYAAVFLSFFVLLGAHALWEGIYAMPARYDTLAKTGVPVWLKVTRCATGIGGGRGFACKVSLDYAGQNHVWTYRYEVRQFYPYTPGEPVAALLDPANPSTVYTVQNVHDRVGAGWASVNTVFGAGCEVFAGFFGAMLWAIRRQRRRLRLAGAVAHANEALSVRPAQFQAEPTS